MAVGLEVRAEWRVATLVRNLLADAISLAKLSWNDIMVVLCSFRAFRYLFFQYWAWHHHLVTSLLHNLAIAVRWQCSVAVVVGVMVIGVNDSVL